MADFVHDQVLLADAASFTRAPNASVTAYDANDAANSTPLALKDINGLDLTNPMVSSADAFTPAFVTTVPQVKLVGGGLSVLSASYRGLRDEAIAASASAEASKLAAESSATNAGAAASTILADAKSKVDTAASAAVKASEAAAAAAGLVGAPADDAVAALMGASTATAAGVRGIIESVFESALGLNVLYRGVRGDGVTNDAPAIQAVINANPGKKIKFPAARYRINSAIEVTASNTVLDFEPGAVLVSGSTGLQNFIKVTGAAFSNAAPISTAADDGAVALATSAAHSLTAGDIFRIKSQRISTSVDAGGWQLGWSTGTTPGPVFSEFGRVRSVQNSTSFQLDTGLTYPGYRPDKTQETDTRSANPSAIVEKFNPVVDVRIINPTLEGVAVDGIIVTRAMGVTVEGSKWKGKTTRGRFVQFVESYMCEARDNWISFDLVTDTAEGDPHDQANAYHIVGSQLCGFDNCAVVRGSQCFDITYSNASPFTSQFCYIRNCTTVSALYNCATTHPGTYASTITGNKFTDCMESGIHLRSNKSIVSGNTIRGSGDGWGFAIAEGGGRDSVVTANVISNFRYPLAIRDGASKRYAGWIGLLFASNIVDDFLTGFYRSMDVGAPLPAASQGITLRDNHFTSDRVGAVGVETGNLELGVNGLSASSNRFRLTATPSTVLAVTANSQNINFERNEIDAAKTLMQNTGGTRTIAAPTTVKWRANSYHGAIDTGLPTQTVDFQLRNDKQEPELLLSNANINEYKTTGAWRTGSTSNVQIALGFPGDSWDGWLEVTRITTTNVFQRFYRRNTSNLESWQRRWNGTSWSTWALAP